MTTSELTMPNRARQNWMFGAFNDVAFFYGSILFGCLLLFCERSYCAAAPIWAIILLNALGAGPLHQGATWFQFLDRKNRARFTSSLKATTTYVIGPIVVFVGTIALMMLCPPAAVLIFFAWSLQHIVAQNTGILLLYHNHDSNEARADRGIELRSQWMPALTFGLIFTFQVLFDAAKQDLLVGGPHIRLTPFSNAVTALSYGFPVVAALGVYSGWLVLQYIYQLLRQVQQGKTLNVPALLFWLYSISSMVPLVLFGGRFEEANLIPSTVHWFQYILLNSVLVKNKYTGDRTADLPTRAPAVLFVQVCLLAVVLVMGTSVLAVSSAKQPLLQQLLISVVMAFGGVHYYLDAFVWRFKDEHIRQATLPYLLPVRV